MLLVYILYLTPRRLVRSKTAVILVNTNVVPVASHRSSWTMAGQYMAV